MIGKHTISEDRRLTPIVVARGNHEYSNKTLIDLFDVQTIGLYYAHTFRNGYVANLYLELFDSIWRKAASMVNG